MGHAMFVTLQDIMARYARMAGRKTLWLPGTDHAGIATQVQSSLAATSGVVIMHREDISAKRVKGLLQYAGGIDILWQWEKQIQ
jgi:valyl-tRNA synthetase